MNSRIVDMSALKLAYAAQQLTPNLDVLCAEPIAVIGMSCRFPGGSDSLQGYWHLLREGIDAIGEIPKGRWDLEQLFATDPKAPGKMYCRHGGYLPDVASFDPEFFNITPREAKAMDPQQRLVLEVAWESLVHAGIDPVTIYGTDTGVMMGAGTFDYAAVRLASGRREAIDPYFASGTTLSVVAGRLSYTLGLNGPSFVVDTACSSSLVAVHLACEALRRRECNMALAGGVGLILAPELQISFCKAHMLAPDGRCKTFDASANGYGRGEGCGVVVLKRLSAAIADENRILAVIRGSAVNQDGASGGLTVPSGPSQQLLIRNALSRAGLRPDAVDYVEAHGTGTPLGDPIELRALGEVFCKEPRSRRLYVGSVKTNLGHLESAAGIAGFIKMVLAMNHGLIPRHLHFKTPNPKLDWDAVDVAIPTELTTWTPGSDGKRRAGASAFGFSGTNAFVVLESFGNQNQLPEQPRVPFQRRRLWMDDLEPVKVVTTSSQPTVLPGRRLALPFSDEIRFEMRLESGAQSFIDDHRIYDTLIIAGAAHLAFAIESACAAFGNRPKCLARVTFVQALTLSPESGRDAQLIFKSKTSDTLTFDLVSSSGNAARNDDWTRHVRGELHLLTNAPPTPLRVDVAGMQEAAKVRDGAALYAEIGEMGHHLGPSFRRVQHLWTRGREGVSRLSSPLRSDAPYRFHPGLLDSCFHWLCIEGPKVLFGDATKEKQENEVYVPFHIETVKFWDVASPPETLYCHTRMRSEDQSDGSICGDIHLFDGQGRSLLVLEGLTVRRLRRGDLSIHADKKAEQWLYELAWIDKPIASERQTRHTGRHWLLFADAEGIAGELGQELINAGHRVTMVDGPTSDPAMEHVCSARGAALVELLQRQGPFSDVVDLRGFSTRKRTHGGEFPGGCDHALDIVHALGKMRWSSPPSVHFIARAGWMATAAGDIDPFAAPIWGLARTIRHEYPEWKVGLVDLDGPASISAAVRHLLEDDHEADVCFKDGRRFVARLVRAPSSNHQPLGLSPHKTYLLTGGTGALGLATAEFFVARGARHLVLVGRSVERVEVQQFVTKMQEKGANVRLERTDLSDAGAVRELVERLGSGGPPLGGVVHCAGIVDDGLLSGQTTERIARVMSAKARGAWLLHEYTRNLQLDFLVFFSSMSSVLGRRGQGGYAAANAFLDGLAHFRRAQGLPALSINWGGWQGMGMAARMDDTSQMRLDAEGIGLIPPQTGLDLLESSMASNEIQVGVFPIDWPKYLVGRDQRATSFFEQIVSTALREDQIAVQGRAPRESEILRALRVAAAAERPALLNRFLRDSLARIMGLDDPAALHSDARLFDIGMDSIMALSLQDELESGLAITLTPTLVFNHPTPRAIVTFLLAHALVFEPEAVEDIAVAPRMVEAADAVTEMDSELAREAQRLDDKLAQLKKWMDS